MTETQSPTWSRHNPRLQKVWDSTSLQEVMFCPRKYEYTMLEGWGVESEDLRFGGFFASAMEHFWKARIGGASRDDAQLSTLRWLLTATWQDGSPWGGHVEKHWHCLGTEKYKNAKGNAAKCPFSHKGALFPPPMPHVCGECGSPTEEQSVLVSQDAKKNRKTLVRAFIWYVEEQPEDLDAGMKPYVFPDGKVALELSFRLPLPYGDRWGEPYMLAGHIDQIGDLGSELFEVDQKSTGKALDKNFFASYEPSMQLDTYDVVGSVLFPELDLAGVMVDGIQTLVGGARFGRQAYYKTESQREEQWALIETTIRQAEAYAEAGHWPMNKRSCWLCPFKRVCARPPEDRAEALETSFTKRERWDPSVER